MVIDNIGIDSGENSRAPKGDLVTDSWHCHVRLLQRGLDRHRLVRRGEHCEQPLDHLSVAPVAKGLDREGALLGSLGGEARDQDLRMKSFTYLASVRALNTCAGRR